MKLRAILLTLLLGGALLYYRHEEARGRFQEAEQWFLDFLVANARDTFTSKQSSQSNDVVIVEFRESEKEEFSAWPPAPLDYIMALKQIAPHEPEVVAFATPMKWSGAQVQFINQLRDRLVNVPSVVFAFELLPDAKKADADETDFFTHSLPTLGESEGGRGPALQFFSVTAIPDNALRPAAHFGFAVAATSDEVPMVATDGKRLVPSLAAQALTLFRHAPHSEQRLRFGNGARLSLGERFVVPLNDAGALRLNARVAVPKMNALELLTPDMGDETGQRIRGQLGKHKAIVFTLSASEAGSDQARALAQSLLLPSVSRAGNFVMWTAVALVCLLGCWQLRRQRLGALVFGFIVMIMLLLTHLLVFQVALVWWPPFAALAASLVSTIFCFLFPNKAAP